MPCMLLLTYHFTPCSCAYVLVCERDENRIQAESILLALVKLIQEHVTSQEQKNAEVKTHHVMLIFTTQAKEIKPQTQAIHYERAGHKTVISDLSLFQIMLKAEKVTAILHQFLPNGQLLFLNHKVVMQYEKQLERLLAGK